MSDNRIPEMPESADDGTVLQKRVDRREALGLLAGGLAAGAAAVGACTPLSAATPEERELKLLEWEQFTQKHYRRMTAEERAETIQRLERLAKLKHNEDVTIATTDAMPGVRLRLRLQHFQVQGVPALRRGLHQREQPRRATWTCSTSGSSRRRTATSISMRPTLPIQHEVPVEGHFYIGTQCFPVRQSPLRSGLPGWGHMAGTRRHRRHRLQLVRRMPVRAWPPVHTGPGASTGTRRRCHSAEVNPNQHYLGNRARKQGVVEKCTFCIHRTRQGRLPACVEACPTGARVFGNLLDPDSEIRWVLANKRVFRLKEELKTEPRFWYFTD